MWSSFRSTAFATTTRRNSARRIWSGSRRKERARRKGWFLRFRRSRFRITTRSLPGCIPSITASSKTISTIPRARKLCVEERGYGSRRELVWRRAAMVARRKTGHAQRLLFLAGLGGGNRGRAPFVLFALRPYVPDEQRIDQVIAWLKLPAARATAFHHALLLRAGPYGASGLAPRARKPAMRFITWML